VLVTAQTSKPLSVLRDKLPQDKRSLGVAQLQSTVGKDNVLHQSISEISSNLGERHTKFSEDRVSNIRKELRMVREARALLANRLREYILADSTETINIDGDHYKPIDAAKLINEHHDNEALSWYLDAVNFSCEINFEISEVNEVAKLLSDLKPVERELHKYKLPDVSALPLKDEIAHVFSSYHELIGASKYWDDVFGVESLDMDFNELSKLIDQLKSAKRVLASISHVYQTDIFNNCVASQHERDKWNIVIERIREKLKIIGENRNDLLGHVITGEVVLPLHDLYDAVDGLADRVVKRGKIGAINKLLLSSNSKKVLASYKVNDRVPDTLERVTLLRKKIIIEKTEREIQLLLKQGFAGIESHPDIEDICKDSILLEASISSLAEVVNYYVEYKDIGLNLDRHKRLSRLIFTSKDDIEELLKLLSSLASKMELKKAECALSGWYKALSSYGDNAHEIVYDLQESIQKRSIGDWNTAFDKINILQGKLQKSLQLRFLSDKLGKFAPKFYAGIVEAVDHGVCYTCPPELRLKWKIARLESWLNHIHKGINLDVAQPDLERLAKRELDLNADLITVLSWQRQIDKVTKQQRDALMAWSEAMRKYGKGTGKYAKKWLREAQESLKEAISAVPVWIMPMTRAAQMFSNPKAGMFDVVIFDEASQCDIRGLTLSYLGKKLLV
ncbi:MAG TPA: hypothetical protein VLH77_04295, partial [Gammaproteobacteria bacterium]|nr:hypothetical protein [Gammaproteobacteria bacterium]